MIVALPLALSLVAFGAKADEPVQALEPAASAPSSPALPPASPAPPGAWSGRWNSQPRAKTREPEACCRYALRFDPFELLYRRATFEAEIALFGPLALEIVPSYIFDARETNLTARGFSTAIDVVYYPSGVSLRGFWVKGRVGYERFDATLSHSADSSRTDAATISSPVFGALFGSTTVVDEGGFSISGGLGIGVVTSDPRMLRVSAPNHADEAFTFYDKSDRLRLLGSLALGATF
jgi:hypothetical protein